MSKFKMSLDLNVLNHLGLNLYSNVPAVLSEVVANSWDADAENVTILWEPELSQITITDDGIGMTAEDINNKYLTVGYPKREKGDVVTAKQRHVMGRKGIGKLSVFSIAEEVELHSVKKGIRSALVMNIKDIQKTISDQNSKYSPKEIECDPALKVGTKIVLRKIRKKMLSISHDALRRRISRRFTVISPEQKFNVSVNGKQVTINDRDYFSKLQLCYLYDNYGVDVTKSIPNTAKVIKRNNTFANYEIAGWLGTAEQTTQLNADNENINKIVIVVRGKVAQEDILATYGIGSIFSKYVFGEIRADFLDEDEKADIATSSRQQIIEDDERYIQLATFIRTELTALQKTWESIRAEEGTTKALEIPSVKEWFSTLEKDSKAKAKSLFGKISKMQNSPEEYKVLLKHSILAFETLRYRDQLDIIDNITDENVEEIVKIFETYDNIEASLYHSIAKGRIKIIRELSEKIDTNEKEKVLQRFIFDHLWLLDPMWERATDATPQMEKSVSKLFEDVEKQLTEEERRARVDIKYKTSANKHIIIELKRASVVTKTSALYDQMSKYRFGMQKLLRQHGEISPEIECICVVGKDLSDWGNEGGREASMKVFESQGMRLLQYDTLIEYAYKAYSEYLSVTKKVSNIQRILDEIDKQLTPTSIEQ
ncbi:Histidine kinase-, DNA gyrase B-, and HSP90-like ATPase [anaerobic digester metagenome]